MTDPFLLVAEIADLKARGKTWAEIAAKTGCPDGRTAKRMAKHLAKQANTAAAVRRGRAVAVAERLIDTDFTEVQQQGGKA